ncbi:hypothetical protein CPIN18021_0302 [Campylobacter pinnipediorum subsp. caledonicus]|uniref:Uncharacterized protein n=1 Tax=Campylobacter pinnipediorum subsp. caledonicus TaxID=1874362 RepID=A0A1S6U638_9BACT|nr:hypothetical protein [Campylobacter pinnipediorum]AQW87149.1 hypothetical protein CPIN18021_0302 [Campylobacter pinnipediorum subsp. caledonicus]OPA72023.1 hypothetical protein BB381_00275 [Campylobacter pinnipediorum subsp. caledonicus]
MKTTIFNSDIENISSLANNNKHTMSIAKDIANVINEIDSSVFVNNLIFLLNDEQKEHFLYHLKHSIIESKTK